MADKKYASCTWKAKGTKAVFHSGDCEGLYDVNCVFNGDADYKDWPNLIIAHLILADIFCTPLR